MMVVLDHNQVGHQLEHHMMGDHTLVEQHCRNQMVVLFESLFLIGNNQMMGVGKGDTLIDHSHLLCWVIVIVHMKVECHLAFEVGGLHIQVHNQTEVDFHKLLEKLGAPHNLAE